jgi:hypothetical protein
MGPLLRTATDQRLSINRARRRKRWQRSMPTGAWKRRNDRIEPLSNESLGLISKKFVSNSGHALVIGMVPVDSPRLPKYWIELPRLP